MTPTEAIREATKRVIMHETGPGRWALSTWLGESDAFGGGMEAWHEHTPTDYHKCRAWMASARSYEAAKAMGYDRETANRAALHTETRGGSWVDAFREWLATEQEADAMQTTERQERKATRIPETPTEGELLNALRMIRDGEAEADFAGTALKMWANREI